MDQLQVFGSVVLATDVLERRFMRDTFVRLGARTLPFCRVCWSRAIVDNVAPGLEDRGLSGEDIERPFAKRKEPTGDDMSNLVPVSANKLQQLSSSVPDKAALATAITNEAKVIISNL